MSNSVKPYLISPKTTTKKACPKWTLRDLTQVFILTLILIAAMLVLSDLWFREGGYFSGLSETLISMFLYSLQILALLVPLWLFTRIKYKSSPQEFGLKKAPIKKIFKYIALGYLLYYLASAVFLQLILSFDVEIPGYGEQASHVPLFGTDPFGLIVASVVIVILAPLIEELFFRGYLYQILKKYGGVFWGSVFSASIFALFHLEFTVFIPIFILGVILNWIFERSGSLWTSIIFHMVNNSLAFLIELALYFEWIQIPI